MTLRKLFVGSLFLLLFSLATFAQTAPQEKIVTVFGANISYLEAGDAAKPTVILLHGLGANNASWQFNIQAFAANYHVFAPDQIGFGKSDKPMLKYRVGTYVDFLDKFMSELKIEKASLVGNSLGGWIAALTAIKYPNRVEKIVLADAAGLKPSDVDMKLIYSLNFSTRDEVRSLTKLVFYNQEIFGNEIYVDEAMRQRVLAGDAYTINSLIDSIKRDEDFLNGQLGQIKKPALIIWGKQDGLLKLTDGEQFKKEIAGAQLVVFDQCGHVPQVEKAMDFNREVLKFLNN
ncbi:MAG TPA: alpha/beta fold hydrolase [Pyrinomonadaceae bacterium]|jgi:pimeloyl-ACP methyl ester carboxylesterase